MRHLFWLALSVAGCASDAAWRWPAITPAELAAGKGHPGAAAVVLLHERTIDLFTSVREPSWYRDVTHERRLILGEAGFKYAEVKLSRHKDERTEFLHARIISPDGQVEEVDAGRVLAVEQKSEKDQSKNRVEHRFRFPNVKVGSVLEWVVGTQRFGLLGYLDEEIANELPVQRYALEMRFRWHAKYALKAYNTNAKFQTERRGEITHVSLEARDVPAIEDEDHAPPRALREPHVVYRAQGFDWGRGERPYFADWPSTMKATAVALYLENQQLRQGVSLSAADGCADRRCIIDRAIALVREQTRLTGFVGNTDQIRPLKQVLASGTANNHEKAYLLWHLLDKAKVGAKLAVLARNGNGTLDPSFPLPMPFDHLIVFVPKQLGVEAAMFVDPSCEHCALGQLPSWSRGCDALVLSAEHNVSEEPTVKAEFETLQGAPAALDSLLRTARTRLDATGDLEVELSDEWRGRDAVDRHIHTEKWLSKDWNDDAERVARARGATARVLDSQHDQCDRARGLCRRVVRFRVPGYATSEGGRWLVPLTVLHSAFDSMFSEVKRKHDLDFRSALRLEEIARFRLPDGWVVDELPAAARETSPAFDVEFTVGRDGNEVVARRTLERRAGRFARDSYEQIRRVIRSFGGTRDKMLVLRKSTP